MFEEGEIKKEDLDKPTEYNVKTWGSVESDGYLFEGKKEPVAEGHKKNEIYHESS